MRKIFFSITIIALLSSCKASFYQYYYVVDFKSYHEQGFFITESNSVNFEYNPVGSVSVLAGGFVESIPRKNKEEYGNSPKYELSKGGGKFLLTTDGAMSIFVDKCKELNADGVINFVIVTMIDKNDIPSHRLSGMAIKRK